MECFKTLFFSSEFPWVRENISSKCVDNLGTRPLKMSLFPDLCSSQSYYRHISNITDIHLINRYWGAVWSLLLLQSALQPLWVLACSSIVDYSQQECFYRVPLPAALSSCLRCEPHACTTGWYAAIIFTASITTSTEKPYSVVLAKHRTAPWWWFLCKSKHVGVNVIIFNLF